MNEDKKSNAEKAPIPRGIGALAERKRQQLARFDEERRRAEEKARVEREQLAREMQEAVRRANRQQRNIELNEQKRLKFVLGGLWLGTLSRQGPGQFIVSAQDLLQLDDKERDLLHRVLSAMQLAAEKATKGRRTAESDTAEAEDTRL